MGKRIFTGSICTDIVYFLLDSFNFNNMLRGFVRIMTSHCLLKSHDLTAVHQGLHTLTKTVEEKVATEEIIFNL